MVTHALTQTLYKTQAQELREESEERARASAELEEERNNLAHQLQLTLARADAEALARSIAEETVADLEKDKTMKELELKDLLARHRSDLTSRDSTINNVSLVAKSLIPYQVIYCNG
jgi:hypothetical protein